MTSGDPSAPNRRPIRSAVFAGIVLAAAQAGLWAPHLLRGEIHLPVSPRGAPPWADPARPPAEVQDWAGTDRIIFNYPNVVRWTDLVVRDPAALLWNPDNWCGIPFLATQDTHVLYPLNAVYLVAGPVHGLLASAMIHGWIASFLAWAALRRWKSSMGAALLGGIVFGCSGWFIANQDRFQFIQAAAWTPLIAIGADIAVRERRIRGPVLLAAGLALSFLGGMPQITAFGVFTAGIVAAAGAAGLLKARRPRAAASGLALALAGVLAGALLAGPQLAPTIEFSRFSARSAAPPDAPRPPGLSAWELTGIVAPEFLGNPPEIFRLQRAGEGLLPPGTTEDAFPLLRLARAAGTGATFIERCFAPGAAALVLALLALARRPDPKAVAGALLVALGVLGAMGTPVLDALRLVPGLGLGNPRRFVFLAVAGFAALAAAGADAAAAGVGRRRLAAVAAAAVLPAAAAALSALAAPGWWSDLVAGLAATPALADAVPGWVLRKAGIPAVFAAFAVLALAGASRNHATRTAALALLLLSELALLNRASNPGQAADPVFPETGLTRWLAGLRGDLADAPAEDGSGLARLVRFKSPETDVEVARGLPAPMPPNLNLLHGVPDVQGYEALVDRRLEEVFDLVEPGLAVEHHLLREVRARAALDSPILDLVGARHVLASGFLDLPRLYLSETELVAVYENPGALPRWQMPARIRVVATEAEVLAGMGSAGFRPDEEAFLLAGDARALGLAPGADGMVPGAPDGAALRLQSYTPTEVRWEYEAREPTPVFWADAFHPGWTARIEGRGDLPLVRADHAFRMLVLPPGKGTLVGAFRPISFWWGCVAAAVGVLMLAITWWVLRREGRRPVRPGVPEAGTETR